MLASTGTKAGVGLADYWRLLQLDCSAPVNMRAEYAVGRDGMGTAFYIKRQGYRTNSAITTTSVCRLM